MHSLAASPDTRPPTAAGRPLRILLVTDARADADRMLDALGRGGLDPSWERVETADGLRAALASGPWDAVLSDYTLPGFGAVAALGVVRAADPDVPFVVVSGAVGEDAAVELMRATASDYILKHDLVRLAPAVEREVREAGDRRARRAAARAAAHLAAVVESSDDAIVTKTLDGVVTSWNPASERLYGWPAAEAIGRPITFHIPPDKAEEHAGIMARLRAGERVGWVETVRLHRDGRRIDVSLAVSPVRGADGGLGGVSKVTRDIGERKRAEAVLRASEARYRGLIESIPALVWVCDDGGRPVLYNRRWDEYTGPPAGDARADGWQDALHPDDAGGAAAAWERCRAGGEPYTYEFRLRRADGAYRWFLTHVTAQRGPDGIAQWVGVCTDIDDRKRSEDDLRRTTDLLRAVADGTPDAVYVKDRDGRYLLFNEAAARFVGRPAAAVLGHDDTALFDPDGARRLMRRDRRVMETGVAGTQEEELTAGGTTRTYLVIKIPYRDAAGRVIGLMGVARDVTAQKRADAALRASEEQLRSFVEHVSAPVAMLDRDMRYLHVSRRWLTDYHLGDRDLTGLSHYEVFPTIPEGWKDIHRRCLAGAVDRCEEARFDRGDGTEQWIRWEVRPWLQAGGGVGGILMFTEDITARKRADAALRASEERLRTLVAATTAIVWYSPPSGAFDTDQPGWTAFTGQTVAQHRGWGWLDAIHPDDRGPSGRAWAAAVADRTPYQIEHRVRRADGEYRHMSARAVPVLDPAGAIREWVGVHADVTDRVRAEAAVRDREERYRRLADAMPQIVWVTRPDGYHEFYNRQWYDYTGLDFDRTKGEGWNDVFHPADQPVAWDRWQHSLATGDPYEVEYRCRRADGEYRWFLGRALPQRDEAGRVVRWFGTCTDIHDFKRAEAERADLLAQLNLQIERMPVAYMLTGPDGRCTRWNPAAERMFGYTGAEAVGNRPADLIVPPQSRPDVEGVFARLRGGDMDAHSTNENVTRDGRVLVCEWYNTPLFGADGTFQGVLSLALDVTARRHAEQTLHLRDRAIRAVAGGLIITDAARPDHPIIYVSPGFELLTGYAAAEAAGRNCRFLQGKDTDPAAVARVRDAVRAEEPVTVEVLNYRKDGTTFWNELTVSPVRDDAGRLTHSVGVQTDVTARRSLEEQFRQVQKMDAIGQLAGGVAHDFNNLLTIINGYSDLLLTTLPPDDPARELVGEILKAGERSAGLTRQLLAFSRKQVLAPRVLDLNGVVADTDKMLRRLIGEDVRLTAALDPGLWAVRADPGQVEQVLMNLAVNARDAMPKGGRLTVETRNVVLDEDYARTHPDARPGRHVLLAVTDTGGGMSAEVKARVFEPFFTTKGAGKGTGLGLATVYGIVRQSGGHVAVYSEVGVGTAFKVYLPPAAPAGGRAEPAAAAAAAPRGTETVLVVEDEDGVRALTRHVLAGCGYTVLEAADGDEAARVAARHPGPIHLLVTDVVMPGIGGRAVAASIAETVPGVRVLFVSGYTDDAVIRHGVLGEGMNFLQKPYAPAALAGKVRAVLDAPPPPG